MGLVDVSTLLSWHHLRNSLAECVCCVLQNRSNVLKVGSFLLLFHKCKITSVRNGFQMSSSAPDWTLRILLRVFKLILVIVSVVWCQKETFCLKKVTIKHTFNLCVQGHQASKCMEAKFQNLAVPILSLYSEIFFYCFTVLTLSKSANCVSSSCGVSRITTGSSHCGQIFS